MSFVSTDKEPEL